MLALHRMRAQWVKFRMMQINGLRGLLAEYGEILPIGRKGLEKLPEILLRLSERLPAVLIPRSAGSTNGSPSSNGGCKTGRKTTRRSKPSARFPASDS